MHYLALFLCSIGAFFFAASTLGLLRFPDVYTRLHALTKADNIGLGLVILGIFLESLDGAIFFKLVLVWLSVLIASSSSCYLIARTSLRLDIKPWEGS